MGRISLWIPNLAFNQKHWFCFVFLKYKHFWVLSPEMHSDSGVWRMEPRTLYSNLFFLGSTISFTCPFSYQHKVINQYISFNCFISSSYRIDFHQITHYRRAIIKKTVWNVQSFYNITSPASVQNYQGHEAIKRINFLKPTCRLS